MVQAAYSLQPFTPNISTEVRSSEPFFGEVYSLHTLHLLEVQHPWLWGGQN